VGSNARAGSTPARGTSEKMGTYKVLILWVFLFISFQISFIEVVLFAFRAVYTFALLEV
jgi:hypothetical protein